MDEERTIEAVGSEPPREVNLTFDGTGLDMLGWAILAVLSWIPLSIPQAWWKRGFYRWVTRHVQTDDGSKLAFLADPKAIWHWFPILWILNMGQHPLRDSAFHTLPGVLGMLLSIYVSWVVTKWWVGGFRIGENVGFRFTGSLLQYFGWSILFVLSLPTIIGWAWVEVAYMRWLYRHTESADAELRMVGKPLELLGIGVLCFVVPLALMFLLSGLSIVQLGAHVAELCTGLDLTGDANPINKYNGVLVVFWLLSLPWIMTWIAHWIIGNTKLTAKYPVPAAVETPVAAD
jgi:uncharacterized membrane protein YjgN (DUF898 family)